MNSLREKSAITVPPNEVTGDAHLVTREGGKEKETKSTPAVTLQKKDFLLRICNVIIKGAHRLRQRVDVSKTFTWTMNEGTTIITVL